MLMGFLLYVVANLFITVTAAILDPISMRKFFGRPGLLKALRCAVYAGLAAIPALAVAGIASLVKNAQSK